MTVSILLHGLLGSALACVVCAVGLGCVRGLRRGELFAYPPGLLLVTAACALVVVEPWLLPASAALVLAPVALLGADRQRAVELLARAARPVLWSLPAALGLAYALGRLNHGPTATQGSSAYGDMLFYAAKVVAASESLFPFRDLTVAGERHVFVESSWVLVGAALTDVPGFDPILFQACAAPAFLVTAVAAGAGFLLSPSDSTAWRALTGLLAVAAIPYPSWITETPPIALAIPLGFSIYGLWRVRLPPAALATLLVVLVADLYLTKGFGLLPLAVVAAVVLARDHPRRLLPYAVGGAVLALAGAVVFALTSAWLVEFFRFGFPLADAFEGLWSQLDRGSAQELGPAAVLAGELLLGIALARARAYTLLGALAASVLANSVVAGHRLDVTVGLAVFMAALFFAESDELRTRPRLVAAAAVALVIGVWFRDIVGVRGGFVLVTLLSCGLVLALASRWRPALVGACALGMAFAFVLGLRDRGTTLQPDAYAVWKRVHEVVPENGLVFTTLTGDVIADDQGWNYYPGVAGRQIYLAGWSNSPLLVDERERRRRLALNRRVLSGAAEPSDVDTEHDAAFAVMRRSERAPASFRLLYRNARFALYRIT